MIFKTKVTNRSMMVCCIIIIIIFIYLLSRNQIDAAMITY